MPKHQKPLRNLKSDEGIGEKINYFCLATDTVYAMIKTFHLEFTGSSVGTNKYVKARKIEQTERHQLSQ